MQNPVLKKINDRVLCIKGQSGCGKSSLLFQDAAIELKRGRMVLIFSKFPRDVLIERFPGLSNASFRSSDAGIAALQGDIALWKPDKVYIDDLDCIRLEDGGSNRSSKAISRLAVQINNLYKLGPKTSITYTYPGA